MSRHGYRYCVVLGLLLATSPLLAQAPSAAAPAKENAADRDARLVELGAALESARSFYQAGAYDQCTAAYSELLTEDNFKLLKDSLPTGLEQARVHYAACLLALGEQRQADLQLQAALAENPLMASPDPVLFPSQVRDLFFKVKGTFLEEIRRAQDENLKQAQLLADKREQRAKVERERIARLEQLASIETVVSKNKRWVAAIPFGVGQFQNGDDALGALFLVSETALLATGIIATSVELGIHSKAEGGRATLETAPLNRNLETARIVGLLATASGLLIGAVGVLEAQLNFVEELPVGQRPRAKPDKSDSALVDPILSVDHDRAMVGLRGTF